MKTNWWKIGKGALFCGFCLLWLLQSCTGTTPQEKTTEALVDSGAPEVRLLDNPPTSEPSPDNRRSVCGNRVTKERKGMR